MPGAGPGSISGLPLAIGRRTDVLKTCRLEAGTLPAGVHTGLHDPGVRSEACCKIIGQPA